MIQSKNTSTIKFNSKSTISYVDTSCASIVRQFFNHDTIGTSIINFNLNSDISYVDTSCNYIIRNFCNYDTILDTYIKVLTTSNKAKT